MTEKIYYVNSNICDFTALVLSCREDKGGWAVVLDRSAFFPEGGGQPGDRGLLGDTPVTDVHDRDGGLLGNRPGDEPPGSGAATTWAST